MKPAAKPELLLRAERVRLVAVPVSYDEGVPEQNRNALDPWKEREACREIQVELLDGKDALGVERWQRVDLFDDRPGFPVHKVRKIVEGLLEMLATTGVLGETQADRDEMAAAEAAAEKAGAHAE